MFPERNSICAFPDLVAAFWLPVSNANETALVVQLTILRNDVTIIAILDVVAGALEQLHIQIAAQAMRWSTG